MKGDAVVAESLLQEILPTLHENAARELRREFGPARLSKTELIHELWLSNFARSGSQILNRGHFFALVSRAMRRILVDEARERLALKRGGRVSMLSLDEAAPWSGAFVESEAERIIEIDILLKQLEARDPDPARVIEMRFYGGFSIEEIAAATGLTVRQVRLRWNRGFAFLRRTLRAL